MPPLSLREFEVEARKRLDPACYDYFAGSADDEVTLRANESGFARIGLVPRVLCGAGKPLGNHSARLPNGDAGADCPDCVSPARASQKM